MAVVVVFVLSMACDGDYWALGAFSSLEKATAVIPSLIWTNEPVNTEGNEWRGYPLDLDDDSAYRVKRFVLDTPPSGESGGLGGE